MPRLALPLRLLSRTLPTLHHPQRSFASTTAAEKGTQNSRPGWKGRHGDDHAVERDRNDVQGDASQEGMKRFEEEKGKTEAQKGEGSASGSGNSSSAGQAITRKDERNSNAKAREEHPEAPGPIIGMNEERGGVSF
jgi:hypothetical protein